MRFCHVKTLYRGSALMVEVQIGSKTVGIWLDGTIWHLAASSCLLEKQVAAAVSNSPGRWPVRPAAFRRLKIEHKFGMFRNPGFELFGGPEGEERTYSGTLG